MPSSPSADLIGLSSITEEICSLLASTTSRELKKVTEDLREVIKHFGNSATSGPGIASVNEELATLMREATVEAYSTSLVGPSGYREGDGRYSGGALLRALESPTMAVGTERGISFGDTRLLDSTARQWARLNFGAGPAVGRHGGFPAHGAGGTLNFGAGISFPGLTTPPRPNFNVPQRGAGYFNGQGEFFLVGKGRPKAPKGATFVGGINLKPSRTGIAAKHFLDAGVEVLAERLIPMHSERLAKLAESLPVGSTVVTP